MLNSEIGLLYEVIGGHIQMLKLIIVRMTIVMQRSKLKTQYVSMSTQFIHMKSNMHVTSPGAIKYTATKVIYASIRNSSILTSKRLGFAISKDVTKSFSSAPTWYNTKVCIRRTYIVVTMPSATIRLILQSYFAATWQDIILRLCLLASMKIACNNWVLNLV